MVVGLHLPPNIGRSNRAAGCGLRWILTYLTVFGHVMLRNHVINASTDGPSGTDAAVVDFEACVPLGIAPNTGGGGHESEITWPSIGLTYLSSHSERGYRPPTSSPPPCYVVTFGDSAFLFLPQKSSNIGVGAPLFKNFPRDKVLVVLDVASEPSLGGDDHAADRLLTELEGRLRDAGRPPPRLVKRSADSDYDYNNLFSSDTADADLIYPAAVVPQRSPAFEFKLSSDLTAPPPYQNDQAAAAEPAAPRPPPGSPSYQVDRRTQILPGGSDEIVPAIQGRVNSVPGVGPGGSSSRYDASSQASAPLLSKLRAEEGARASSQRNEVRGSRPPTLRNPLDQIKVDQGKVFRIGVPANTFHDQVDGDARNLRLELYTIDKRPVDTDKKYSWIKFDHEQRQFYGLPGVSQIGLHEFILAAYNKAGLPVYNAFTIYVQPRPKGYRSALADELGMNHRFWVVMDVPQFDPANPQQVNGSRKVFGSAFRNFKRNVSEQVAFFDALLAYYASTTGRGGFNLSSANPSVLGPNGRIIDLGSVASSAKNFGGGSNGSFYDQIFLDSISKGSVRVTWVNDSLVSPDGLPLELLAESIRARGNSRNYSSTGPCPLSDIEQVASRFVTPDASGQVNPAFRDAMASSAHNYRIRSAGYELMHACSPATPSMAVTGGKRIKPAASRGPAQVSRDYERDLWMTTIIPSLVMALLLLIATLIACCLYRRRRKPRFLNEDRSLFKKGVPVVMYPDEFEDSSVPPIDVTFRGPQSTSGLRDGSGATTSYLHGTGAQGHLRSPINDPSATFPRPPPFNPSVPGQHSSSTPYQPLLSHQSSTTPNDPFVPPNTTQIMNKAYYGTEAGPVGYNSNNLTSQSPPNLTYTTQGGTGLNYSTLNAG